LEFALALVVLAALVALVVVTPLRGGEEADRREDEELARLEAAKEAKYREIRDTELDWRTGKLAEADYRATDRELRAQAMAILRQIDEQGGKGGG
jgi:flagellar biosynthesis/type III secretory pathway M-ring protein FliF/YscJ